MSCNAPFEIRVGDTLVVLDAELTRLDATGVEEAADLTGLTVTFSMVNAATGAVVVDEAAATVVEEDAGLVQYDFQSEDVSDPGVYWGTFRMIDASETAAFPVNPKQCVIWIHGNNKTAEEAYDEAR